MIGSFSHVNTFRWGFAFSVCVIICAQLAFFGRTKNFVWLVDWFGNNAGIKSSVGRNCKQPVWLITMKLKWDGPILRPTVLSWKHASSLTPPRFACVYDAQPLFFRPVLIYAHSQIPRVYMTHTPFSVLIYAHSHQFRASYMHTATISV